jgi:hypothetical protein
MMTNEFFATLNKLVICYSQLICDSLLSRLKAYQQIGVLAGKISILSGERCELSFHTAHLVCGLDFRV